MKRLAIVVGLGALLLVACGDDSTETTRAPGGGSEVRVQGFAFNPGDLTVSVGATVTWANQDGVDHTATADDDTWDGALSGGGGTFEFTFDTAGTFSYHCKIHPSMTGTIIVEG